MIKIYLVSLTLLMFISCAENKEEKMRENIEAKLKPTMKDPASYEFVSMNIIKTITVAERKKTVNEESLNRVRELDKELPSPDLLYQLETEYAFLQRQADENKEATYYVDFIAKGTNSFGGVIQNKYSATVLNDENLTVFTVSENN
jgi:hypothetical protein